MLNSGQTRVGIGRYSQDKNSYSPDGYPLHSGGITSIITTYASRVVMFPAAGATTDLARFNPSGERPDPTTSCPGYDRSKGIGLPIVVRTGTYQDTTAENATITEDGVPVATCAFGSTQYVNTNGGTINYDTGPLDDQVNGRQLLKSSGAVFIIPQNPLKAGKTYAVSVKINGQPLTWSFKTAATLQVQSTGVSTQAVR